MKTTARPSRAAAAKTISERIQELGDWREASSLTFADPCTEPGHDSERQRCN
jgi:hypothetical protein